MLADNRLIAAALFLVCGGAVAAVVWKQSGKTPALTKNAPLQASLDEGQLALQAGNFERALQSARRALDQAPDSPEALLLAGRAAGKAGRAEEALSYFARLPDDDSPAVVEGTNLRGELLMYLGRLSEAEKQFVRALSKDPQSYFAHHRLAYLYSLTGRYWDAVPQLLFLVKSGKFTQRELDLLSGLQVSTAEEKDLLRYKEAAPDDAAVGLGFALLKRDEDLAVTEERLRKVVRLDPGLADAHAWLGWVLAHRANVEAALAWSGELPEAAEEHPLVWVARGQIALSQRDTPGALRCYWEALRRDPNQSAANAQLAALLESEGRPKDAAPFKERGALLAQLVHDTRAVEKRRDKGPAQHRIAERLEALGRYWEAIGWCQLALSYAPNNREIRTTLDRLQKRLPLDLVQTAKQNFPTEKVDLASCPLPVWKISTGGENTEAGDGAAPIKLIDRAKEAGIEFVGYVGGEPGRTSRRFLEQVGGGIGVLDADGDGWPDLYFTQGAPWPVDESQTAYTDRFFRNLGQGEFRDCTSAAGLGDSRFSQGIAAGDYDNDGFADLYVANIGMNRLYRNNGDGTFSDVSSAAGISGESWNTSCTIADINADGWPDLFDVRYVQGEIESICDPNAEFQRCSPSDFGSLPSALLLSRGDGTFVDVSREAGIADALGKGLGLVLGKFQENGSSSLFVSNDFLPNFHWDIQTDESGAIPRLVDKGFATGLALDGDGNMQSCMGVAADDADGDGWLDLFVTNFYLESNTLYLNIGQGKLFQDATVAAGLREPSYSMLGWGTQFIDGDLDGWPDLIVTNGHVDDFTSLGQPFAMRPQFFRNLGNARFVELAADSLGPFFQGEYHGRALARLDWNRDGREDAAIWHIDQPAALLTNETPATGHFLAVQLRGVKGNRDCIGAVVRARVGDRELVKQLVGGDGFHCTNQRQLVFGLGPHQSVAELSIRWPDGESQTFHDVPGDAELIFVEGSNDYIRAP